MNEGKGSSVAEPVGNAEVFKVGEMGNARSILDQIVRDGARKMLQTALEDKVNTFSKPIHRRSMGVVPATTLLGERFHVYLTLFTCSTLE